MASPIGAPETGPLRETSASRTAATAAGVKNAATPEALPGTAVVKQKLELDRKFDAEPRSIQTNAGGKLYAVAHGEFIGKVTVRAPQKDFEKIGTKDLADEIYSMVTGETIDDLTKDIYRMATDKPIQQKTSSKDLAPNSETSGSEGAKTSEKIAETASSSTKRAQFKKQKQSKQTNLKSRYLILKLNIGDPTQLEKQLQAKEGGKVVINPFLSKLFSSLTSLNTRLFDGGVGKHGIEDKKIEDQEKRIEVKEESIKKMKGELEEQKSNVKLAIFKAVQTGNFSKDQVQLLKDVDVHFTRLADIFGKKVGTIDDYKKLSSDEKESIKSELKKLKDDITEIEKKLKGESKEDQKIFYEKFPELTFAMVMTRTNCDKFINVIQ